MSRIVPSRNSGAALLCCAVAALAWLCSPVRADTVAEPSGYRMDEYRAPVPATLKGARVVDTAEAEKLWRDKSAVFFDVMPRAPKPANLPAGTVWRDKPRSGIPGSIWLVNVGYGDINAETEAYFRKGIESQVGDDKSRPILFYCMTDCWMSWNAARRAVSWGYASVLWYPLGSDGWAKAGLPLVEEEPYHASP
ncbi:MAG: PQQ-dependent catabolism-associated CXXCW motif protein [Rhizobiaceae bacterium]|nr:PQQ-dependent catabolism-associated CXXCW motif protein [Rhizobiaceae bacterium]